MDEEDIRLAAFGIIFPDAKWPSPRIASICGPGAFLVVVGCGWRIRDIEQGLGRVRGQHAGRSSCARGAGNCCCAEVLVVAGAWGWEVILRFINR